MEPVAYKTEQQLALGNMLLVNIWERLCNGGAVLQPDEKINMRLLVSVAPWSKFAELVWDNGPYHTFEYTKPESGTDPPQVVELTFDVFSHQYKSEPSVYPPKRYTIKGMMTDVSLGITAAERIVPEPGSGGGGPPAQEDADEDT